MIDFMEVPPLTNNTAKAPVGEDLLKIRPAVAEQSRQKKQVALLSQKGRAMLRVCQ